MPGLVSPYGEEMGKGILGVKGDAKQFDMQGVDPGCNGTVEIKAVVLFR